MFQNIMSIVGFSMFAGSAVAAAPANVPANVVAYYQTQLAETCQTDLIEEEYFAPSLLETGSESPKIYQFPCWRAAYNFGNVFIRVQASGEIQALSFAKPRFDASDRVAGFTTSYDLSFGGYEPESGTMTEFHKWRGVGDAFHSYTYRLDSSTEWTPVLISAEVDSTLDGEINPVTLFDYTNP